MQTNNKLRLLLAIFLLAVVSCSEKSTGPPDHIVDHIVYPPTDSSGLDISDAPGDADASGEEDTYSIYADPCVDCAYYFCPPLDSVWQKQICINNCDDPPTVAFEGECIEYLECDPTQHIMQVDIPCVTDDGFPWNAR